MTDWRATAPAAMRREALFGDRVVRCFAERPGSVHALLTDAAARRPDGEALVCGDTRLTWAEVLERGAAVAQGLARLGVGAGDRVALLLGNRIEFVLAGSRRAPRRHRGAARHPAAAARGRLCARRLRRPRARARAELADRVPSGRGAGARAPHPRGGGPRRRRRSRRRLGQPAGVRARRRGGHRGDPLHLGHHRPAEGRDADPSRHRPLGDALRVLHGARRRTTAPSLAVPMSHVTGLIAIVAAMAAAPAAHVMLPPSRRRSSSPSPSASA